MVAQKHKMCWRMSIIAVVYLFMYDYFFSFFYCSWWSKDVMEHPAENIPPQLLQRDKYCKYCICAVCVDLSSVIYFDSTQHVSLHSVIMRHWTHTGSLTPTLVTTWVVHGNTWHLSIARPWYLQWSERVQMVPATVWLVSNLAWHG